MKTHLIISLFVTLCAVFCIFTHYAHADDPENTLATHMWLQNYDSLIYVPVRSLEQCEMFVRQAALINSSEGLCYLNENLIKKIECVKSTKKDGEPDCK